MSTATIWLTSVSATVKTLLVFFLFIIFTMWPKKNPIVNSAFISDLSRLGYYLLMPCLVLDKIGAALSMELFQDLWPLLVWSAIHLLVGFLVGELVFHFIKTDIHREIVVTCTFNNSAAVPLLLLESLCHGGGDFLSATAADCEKAVGYVFIYSIPWNIALFVLATEYLKRGHRRRLLLAHQQAHQQELPGSQGQQSVPHIKMTPAADSSTASSSHDGSPQSQVEMGTLQQPKLLSKPYVILNDGHSSEPSPLQQPVPERQATAVGEPHDPHAATVDHGLPRDMHDFHVLNDFRHRHPRLSLLADQGRRMSLVLRDTLGSKLAQVANPPTIATLLGLLVCLSPWLKHQFYQEQTVLRPVMAAISAVGTAAIPCSNVVLVGALAQSKAHAQAALGPSSAAGAPAKPQPKLVTAAVVATRLVLIPLAQVALLALVGLRGPNPLLPDDDVLKLTLVVEAAVPSAQLVMMILLQLGLKEQAAPIAATYLWMYAFSLVSIGVFVSLGLMFVFGGF